MNTNINAQLFGGMTLQDMAIFFEASQYLHRLQAGETLKSHNIEEIKALRRYFEKKKISITIRATNDYVLISL